MFNCNIPNRNEPIVGADFVPTRLHWSIIDSLVKRVYKDIYLTDGAPDASLGATGDAAIDLSSLLVYSRGVSGWDAGVALGNTSADALKLITSMN